MYYSVSTFENRVNEYYANFSIPNKELAKENQQIVNSMIRRKVKTGRYIAVLDIYPDKPFKCSKGSSVNVYLFNKNLYNGKTKDELVDVARSYLTYYGC